MEMKQTVLFLTGSAMAEFHVQGLFAAYLVLNFSAVAGCRVAGFEIFVAVVNAVGSALLPG